MTTSPTTRSSCPACRPPTATPGPTPRRAGSSRRSARTSAPTPSGCRSDPYTVKGSYWKSYRGVIDAASDKGFKVIVSYWEGTGARKDGFIDDPATFWPMWNTVVKTYNDKQVYFEPMNKPTGYTDTEWADIAAKWLATYPSVPRDRVFVEQHGYNDHVTSRLRRPTSEGHLPLPCTTTASGRTTPPTTSGCPTSRSASVTARAVPSPTSSAPR